MKYGIYLPNFGAFGSARALADLAHDAESAGWDGFFIWDHFAGFPGNFVDPWVGLTAAAMVTDRIRLGTTVTPIPRRRPWKLARETASLDRLSGGRLILGVGIGGGRAEIHNFGEETDAKARGQMLDEALDILAGLWRGELFTYEGKFYNVKEARFLPAPAQSPRIPVWVGGFWPNKRPMRRAARWDGVFPLFRAESTEEELQQLKDALACIHAHRESDAPFDVVCTGVTDAENAAASIAPYVEAGATWWLEAIAPYRFGHNFEPPFLIDELRERVRQGPPRAL